MAKFTYYLRRSTKKKTLKSGNQMISANDRLHFHVKAEITAYLRALAGKEEMTEHYSPENPCDVIVTLYSPTKRASDPPNYYPTVKALLDGLTDAGLWTDDNYHIINLLAFKYGGLSGVKGTYRIDIEVKPCQI